MVGFENNDCLQANLFQDAWKIAIDAHRDQVDKNGEPYFDHVRRVAVPFIADDDSEAAIVALLHDTVEDTYVSLDFLSGYFYDEIIDAVDAISRREGETYRDYIKRLCLNDIARRVKKVDLQDNLRPERLFQNAPIMRYYKALGWIQGYELTGRFD